MKWIGQSITDFIARFRSDVYLESLSTSSETNILVVDSDGKITKNTGAGDDMAFTLTGDSGSNQTIDDGSTLDIAGGTNCTTVVGATDTVTVNVDDAFLVNNGSDTTTGTITAGGFTTAGVLTLSEYTSGTVDIEKVQDSGTGFVDNDTSLMTAAAIADKVEAYGYGTGDITGVRLTADDANVATDAAGSADFTIAGGAGIDTSATGTTVTITGETASATNKGVVELATTGEADTGTDTSRAITAAGLESHVNARYSYQYIVFLADSDGVVSNQYIVPSVNGISNHAWNVDTDLDYTGANATTVDHADAHITMNYTKATASIPIPQTCQLAGFYAVGRNETTNGNNFGVGMFVSAVGDVDWGGTGNWDATLRAFSLSEGTGNERRQQRIDGMLATPYALAAGDLITPAVVAPTGDQVKATITLVLRTALTT